MEAKKRIIKDSKARRLAYNDGYLAGIREVVEFVLSHKEVGFNKHGNVYINPKEWEKKIKEWKIE